MHTLALLALTTLFTRNVSARIINPGTSTFCESSNHKGQCIHQKIEWDVCLTISDSNRYGAAYASWTVSILIKGCKLSAALLTLTQIDQAVQGDSKCVFFWDYGCNRKDAPVDKFGNHNPYDTCLYDWPIFWVDDLPAFKDTYGEKMKIGPLRSYRCQKCDQGVGLNACTGEWS